MTWRGAGLLLAVDRGRRRVARPLPALLLVGLAAGRSCSRRRDRRRLAARAGENGAARRARLQRPALGRRRQPRDARDQRCDRRARPRSCMSACPPATASSRVALGRSPSRRVSSTRSRPSRAARSSSAPQSSGSTGPWGLGWRQTTVDAHAHSPRRPEPRRHRRVRGAGAARPARRDRPAHHATPHRGQRVRASARGVSR